MIHDHKYLVVKREDLDQLVDKYLHNPNLLDGISEVTALSLPDAVVIRTRDITATQALYAYAHQLQFALEIGDFADSNVDRPGLQEVQDYIISRAMEAEDHLKHHRSKFPD